MTFMNPIKFLEPSDFSEAVALLTEHADEAKIIAGGTSVVLMLQQRLIAPGVLVSLGRVPGYDFIRHDADGLHIGALTKLRDLERSDVVQKFCPALAHTFSVVADVRVRNQATIGGNISAADYAADPPAMLTALDARVQVVGPEKKREIPLSEFFLGFYTTALDSNEILTEVIILHYHHPRDELVADIAEEYARTLDPLTDVRGSAWYRKEMIRVFVKRALQEVRDGDR